VAPLESWLIRLSRRLTPDNILARAPVVAYEHGAAAVVFNPNGATRQKGASIAVGTLLGPTEHWHHPGAEPPDGTFGLLRVGPARVELVADATASRTIWWTITDEALIASTSQRAIVAVLGDFRLDRTVLPWVLSSGTLGPSGGWDSRITRLQPGERLTLDRAHWRVSHTIPDEELEVPRGLGAGDYRAELSAAVAAACSAWSFDPGKWLLPLSGGADSRGLLYLLRERAGLMTITWGIESARDEVGNDAQLARTLAARFGVSNRYFSTDFSAEPRERVIERFLAAGEGRVAKISGYLDGFKIWKTLFDEGFDGVIRGDEAFGSIAVRTQYETRYTAGLTLLSDYFRPADIGRFELPPQYLPARLLQHRNETLATWRDRLYQTFRLPTVLAGLTDLKAAYIEVANPLLSRTVLRCVRRLPDDLRTDKRLWREFVRSQAPDIPFASRTAVRSLHEFVSDARVLELMLAEIESANAADLFAPLLRAKIASTIHAALRHKLRPRRDLKLQLVRTMPASVREVARTWFTRKPTLHPMVFAFRAFVASRMSSMLKQDAESLTSQVARAVNL
jgi:hypothetical protein